MNAVAAILSVRGLTARYGKVTALAATDLDVAPGAIVTVIGANGAGKSTLLNALMGSLPINGHSAGSITYDGGRVELSGCEQRVAAGMALVPEKRELFGSMSVEDNLLLGGFRRYRQRGAAAERKSIAFFIAPLKLWLYSGITHTTASARSTVALQALVWSWV